MIAGMAFLRAGRYFETVGWQCKLAVWVTEICLVALASCGRLHDASHRTDAASFGDANVDLPVIRDAAAVGEAGQPCDNALVWEGDYTIASHADLDRLRGYTSIYGSLTIGSDELVDLHGLECLHTVDGSFSIGYCPLAGMSPEPPCTSNANLTSIEGLGIVYVHAGFGVHHAPLLHDLHGLETFRSANQIAFSALPALRSVAGLENIDPGSWIYIADNPLLEDLSAFRGKTLYGSVILTNNRSLASLEGLEMLSVMQSFEIISSPQLSSLAALGLYYVHGDVVIQDLDQIVDLTGLEALSHVGTLTIWANASLRNIIALAKLREITEFVVRENPSLTSLAGLSFAETSLKSVDIAGNSSLSDLRGFEQVTEMGYLGVVGSKTLTSLDGLASLVAVGDNGLSLDNDDALTSLAGLRALARVDGDISVEGNAVLQDVGVLESITFAGSLLTIMNNPSLPNCQARRAYEAQVAKGWKGRARICNNLEDGCEGTIDCAYLD